MIKIHSTISGGIVVAISLKSALLVGAVLGMFPTVALAATIGPMAQGGHIYQQFPIGSAEGTAQLTMYLPWAFQPNPGATLQTTSNIAVAKLESQISYTNFPSNGSTPYGNSAASSGYNTTSSGTAGVTDTVNTEGSTTFNGYSMGWYQNSYNATSTYYNY